MTWWQSYKQNFVLKRLNSHKIVDGALPQTVHSNDSLITT